MAGMLGNILRNLVSRPATRRYPFVKRAPFEGSRGQLQIDADSCVYCGLCSKACPARAIVVSRKPKSWTLDPYRCIVCGYCVEVCPKHCLSMKGEHRPVRG